MIKGILLDKDGTLIDFFSIWPVIAREVIPKLIKQIEIYDDGTIEKEMLESMGLHDDKVNPKGAFAYKSYGEVAEDICGVLTDHDIFIELYSIYVQIKELFSNTLKNSKPIYKTFTDMPELFKGLKDKGIYIGLATADTEESANHCLEELDILEYFDYVGADDGTRKPKPNGEMIDEFKDITGLAADEIMVVGDTFNDMLFGKQNGTKAVGVLSGVSDEKDFDDMADYIIESVADLPELIEKVNAE